MRSHWISQRKKKKANKYYEKFAYSDKKNATTYQLFHRSQNDPLIHDSSAGDHVLHQVSGPRQTETTGESSSESSKHGARNLSDLEKEFGAESLRTNEGEAANYGVFFDDTEYDYMQHLRDLGTGAGEAHFVEADDGSKGKGKASKGMRLEDALKQVDLNDGSAAGSVYDYEYPASTASSYVRKPTYQDQQDIPDAIAGFQPDMDPRLREVLEALDDDAYVDDEDDENLFGKLTDRPEEMEPGEWEDSLFDNGGDDFDDDGWDSDVTEKAPVQEDTDITKPQAHNDNSNDDTQSEVKNVDGPQETTAETAKAPGELPAENEPIPDLEPEHQGWMHEFAKFKKDTKDNKKAQTQAGVERGTGAPSVVTRQTGVPSTIFTAGGTPIRHKKRKGALTNPSSYSMSSSALARTEGHRVLDDRFERLEALYALDEEDEEEDFDDDGGVSMVSGVTGTSSQAPSLVSAGGTRAKAAAAESDGGVSQVQSGGFNQIMDDFLDQWDDNTSAQAKRKGAKAKRGKNGNEVVGMRMLDEIRTGLGPAKPSARRFPGKV